MLSFRKKRRRFICKKCGKKSFDQGDQGIELKDPEVEYEFKDLCDKCFEKERKNMKQAAIILNLISVGKVNQESMEILYVLQKNQKLFIKFKGILLKHNEYVKGWMKEKKKALITELLSKKVDKVG